MATIKLHDRADQFRIEIVGRFSGDLVQEAARIWEQTLSESGPRAFTVDISQLSGYDRAGCKLLRDMHLHGTKFAASTPESLGFLGEISAPERKGPKLVAPATEGPASVTPIPIRLAAGK